MTCVCDLCFTSISWPLEFIVFITYDLICIFQYESSQKPKILRRLFTFLMISTKMDEKMVWLVLIMAIPIVKCAIPGTFFWRPRLGLDLSIPTTDVSMYLNLPTKDNVREGAVVLVDGYQAGLTVVALASGLSSAKPYPHLNPFSAYFYTHSYRWALRHLSLVPLWIGGNGGNYCDTHKVWRRRFFYMDEFVPLWMRKYVFPFIDKNEWKKEEDEFKRFKKYAESAFGKHYRYPTKVFNDFKSQETKETVETIDSSSSST